METLVSPRLETLGLLSLHRQGTGSGNGVLLRSGITLSFSALNPSDPAGRPMRSQHASARPTAGRRRRL